MDPVHDLVIQSIKIKVHAGDHLADGYRGGVLYVCFKVGASGSGSREFIRR